MNIEELKTIYESYGYEYKKIGSVDVFEYKYGRYYGADIIFTRENEEEAKKVCQEYKKDDYATSMKLSPSSGEVEDDLFDGFFKIKYFQSKINRDYENFANLQIDGFDNTSYEYVYGAFSSRSFDGDGFLIDEESSNGNVVDKIVGLIKQKGSKLVVLEAAAGYGKTCTANEIVHKLCSDDSDIIPLHIEISNNREARIFKHILQNEIDEQFKNAVTSKSVERQIYRGRIAVVIDGFDELLSKDCESSLEKKRDVESMLNTIITLLRQDAKVVITSRKTAFFSGDDFFKWIQQSENTFETHRITIAEPNIKDWLTGEKISYFEQQDFPLAHIANPVLLGYLKYSSLDSLKDKFESSKNMVDHYLTFLLDREKTRQKIKWERDEQLRILEKLVRFMCEMHFKAEEKKFIKDLIAEYNKDLFNDYLEKCSLMPKPTHEDLAETLSNHALLDRKKDGNIGFINDFIFGYLIGRNFTEGKFKKHYPHGFVDVVGRDFCLLAINAFRFESDEERDKFYDILVCEDFSFDSEFSFYRDLYLKRNFGSCLFDGVSVEQINFHNVLFDCLNENNVHFSNIVFDACTFVGCKFNRNAFSQSYMANCTFKGCEWIGEESATSNGNLTISNGNCDNDFVESIYVDSEQKDESSETINYEKIVFDMFCKFDKIKPVRKLEDIYKNFALDNKKIIDKTLNQMRVKRYISVDGNLIFIHKDGIVFYNGTYRGA
ncbi:MAG: NACHT domain-containing protein [Fibrobacter sp.]|uniref:NACHT domain-containing protein n=1 Tax=Fibrobacter sp. TaxID=35828 RepID=UPI0025BFB0D6|nr:NACHT domain-containing protein [Fibrobacter sp.]MBQ7080093.1 NACHT domain-containing protein [Fibrobacter sp.]